MKNKNIFKISIIQLLLCACWCVMVLVFADYDKAGFYLWGGFGFGLCNFIIAFLSIIFLNVDDNRSTTELNFIPVYYTAIYLFVSLLIDSYFILYAKGKYNAVLVGLNLIMILIFVGIRIYTDGYAASVGKQAKHVSDKISPIMSISVYISTMITATDDPVIKKQLLKLKENVDYSSNISQTFTENAQNEFLLQLNHIQNKITSDSDIYEIKKMIEEAESLWKKRNSLNSTIR